MKHLLSRGSLRDYFIVIEPGVCFGGYGAEDRIHVKITDEGLLDVTMGTTCCYCSKPMSVRFFLDSYIPKETEWSSRNVRCKNCDVLQVKKIRYYLEEENHQKIT